MVFFLKKAYRLICAFAFEGQYAFGDFRNYRSVGQGIASLEALYALPIYFYGRKQCRASINGSDEPPFIDRLFLSCFGRFLFDRRAGFVDQKTIRYAVRRCRHNLGHGGLR